MRSPRRDHPAEPHRRRRDPRARRGRRGVRARRAAVEEARQLSPAELDALEALDVGRVGRRGAHRVPPVAPRRAAGGRRTALRSTGRACWRARSPVGRRPLSAATRPVSPLHGGHAPAARVRARLPGARRRPTTDDPQEVVAAGLIQDRDGVLLGALLHDVGKNGEGGARARSATASRARSWTDGRRGPDRATLAGSWSLSICCSPTPRPAATSRTTIWSWTSRRGSRRPSGWPPCTSWRKRMRSPPGRPRGRRGDRRSSASWWPRSGACSSGARWAWRWRSGCGSRSAGCGPCSPTSRKPTSSASSCGCRAATSCRSRPRRSRGTTPRSRRIWAPRGADRDAAGRARRRRTSCWSWPPTGRGCSRGSPGRSRSPGCRS